MKRLIQWRPYYLQHQREVSTPTPPPLHSHMCVLSLSFYFSALLSLPLFFKFPPSLSVAPICSWNMYTCRRHTLGVNRASVIIKVWQFVLIMRQTMCTSYVTHLHQCKLHLRGLIDDYLHVEINQYGNCGKPIRVSSSFLLEAFTWWLFMLW